MPVWDNWLSAIIDGECSPEHLDEHKRAMLKLVDMLRDEVPDRIAHEQRSPFRDHFVADGSSTITIMGERGSGKTTLLVSVCAELLRRRVDLVLPVMRPDLFAENESVLSSFLASLWSMFVDWDPGAASDGPDPALRGDTDFVRLLADTARSHAASRTTQQALAHATDSTVDYAEDAIAISRSGARLQWQIKELARRLCLDGADQARLVIVPIDDPDLAPEALRAILRDVRVLGSVPGIVPIASFCPADLALSWTESNHAGGGRSRELLRYEREMEKLFPYRSRFEINAFTAADRVSFAPVGESKSLKDQLADLRTICERNGSRWPIDETLSATEPEFRLPNPLPGNARTLVQLWSTLDQLDPERAVSSEALELTLGHMCGLLTEPLRAELGLTAGARFYEIGGRVEEDGRGRWRIAIRAGEVNLRVGTDGGFRSPLRAPDGMSEIAMRPLSHVTSGLMRDDPTGKPEQRFMSFSDEATSSYLAFQDLIWGSGLFATEGNTRVFLGWVEWAWLQSITLAGLSTDDRFLFLPEATTLTEVLRTGVLWNRLTELVREGMSVHDVLTAFVEAACATLDPRQRGLERPTIGYDEALQVATQLYREHADCRDRASQSFCSWYESDLPYQWHAAFFSGESLRRFCSWHRTAVEEARDKDGRPGVDLRAVLDSRFARILDAAIDEESRAKHCWIAGYFELAVSVGSEHLDRLLPLHRLWRERTAALQAGARVAGDLVTHRVGRRRLSPYPTPEGQALLLAAREALRRRVALSMAAHRSGLQ